MPVIVLKPCPFCGAVPSQPACFRENEYAGNWGLVQCTDCGAQAPDVRTGYGGIDKWAQSAADEWNARAGET